MLSQLFHSGLQLLAMIGLCCILLGTFSLLGVMTGGRGPFEIVKGAALIWLGVYLIGLGNSLG